MTISQAMARAEQAIMEVADEETGEVILHGKTRLAEKIIIEALLAFFSSEAVRQKMMQDEVRNEWKDAIENAMICWEMLPHEGETPKQALNRLIIMEQCAALDPLACEEAAGLVARGRQEAAKEAAEIARNGCLVPPDGGSPTAAESELCDHIANRIMQEIK